MTRPTPTPSQPEPTPDGERDELVKVLLGEGAGEPEQGIHSWRCAYPDRYGPCDCVGEMADAILAAGYRKNPVVIVEHHHDIEKHAEHFNEGYEAAVAQGLADDPTLAGDWLAKVRQEAKAEALRDAADAWSDWDALSAPEDWLRARADRIANDNREDV